MVIDNVSIRHCLKRQEMIKTAYHVTTKECAEQIKQCGFLKPMRLPNVYLLKSLYDAVKYSNQFKKDAIIEVEYDTELVESRWKPSYATEAVIKLKKGECAEFVKEIICTY